MELGQCTGWGVLNMGGVRAVEWVWFGDVGGVMAVEWVWFWDVGGVMTVEFSKFSKSTNK